VEDDEEMRSVNFVQWRVVFWNTRGASYLGVKQALHKEVVDLL